MWLPIPLLWQRLRHRLRRRWELMWLTYHSLTFNSFTTCSTVVDTLMEPLFWFVDHFLKYMGPIFVILVAVLTTSVVLIFYTCLLPHKYELSLFWTMYHLVFGHWLLVSIVFHYVKAAFTSPGSPLQEIPEVVSICKKCIAPKPPRAHHCSVCNRCVLKMDHHCPWLNNCVGHYNHRHFFLFCVYMWVGTVYVTVVAYDLFKQHFFEIKTEYMVDTLDTGGGGSMEEPPDPNNHHVVGLSDESGQYFHHLVIYEFMLCSGVAVALGLLTLWHARLITRGETSIEVHINRKERRRLKKKGLVFRNPYDFGILKNWKRFLGVTHGRSFFRQVLLPSNHKPDGDGLQWQYSTYTTDSGLMLL